MEESGKVFWVCREGAGNLTGDCSGRRMAPQEVKIVKRWVTFHTHANHYADWRGANTVTQPKGLPLAVGDFKWAVPVTIRTFIE